MSTRQTPEQQLKMFVAKFDPANQKLIRAVRKKLRSRFPTATEMVYDNYNFFVIGYSPKDHPSAAPVSLVAGPNGVSLCFMHGAKLKDPEKILSGAGKQTRFLRLPTPDRLDDFAVQSLLTAAVSRGIAFPKASKGNLVIRSVSAKQRSRRKPKA